MPVHAARMPSPVARFLQRLFRDVVELRWSVLSLILAGHLAISVLALALAGESDLLANPVTILYFYATTATTVGYGDLSPATAAGRLVVVLWVFPGSIALFTTVIAKGIAAVTDVLRKRMNGYGDFSALSGAVVLVGYHPARTQRMVEQIRHGGFAGEIVLISRRQPEDLDADVHFVRTETLTDRASLVRAAVERADRVIVYADRDDETLAATLAVDALNPRVHIVAHMTDPEQGDLLSRHTDAEVIVSPTVDMVVRAAQDPGASRLLGALVSSTESETLYSLTVTDPATIGDRVDTAFAWVRERGGLPLALQRADAKEGEAAPTLNPAASTPVAAGDRVFYVRATRITQGEGG